MKKIVSVMLIAIMSACLISGCTGTSDKAENIGEPDIQQIRNICNLATLECYYHNVAKSEKKAEAGVTHIGEKDRKFWIEYTGIARLGVDMSKVEMKISDNKIEITMLEAKVLGISIDEESISEDSYTISEDGFNKNKITAEDQTKAISLAQSDMEKEVKKNKTLLLNAQDRAKKLIENYINQLGGATGREYTVSWN